jgi:hypothetical protein
MFCLLKCLIVCYKKKLEQNLILMKKSIKIQNFNSVFDGCVVKIEHFIAFSYVL